jgi:hypothetical protein
MPGNHLELPLFFRIAADQCQHQCYAKKFQASCYEESGTHLINLGMGRKQFEQLAG